VALVAATVVAWFLPAAHGTVSEELKAEAKVTYSKVLPCVLDSWMMRRRPNATFAFPDDADEHYQDLIKKMGRFRQAKVWRGGFCNPRPHHTDPARDPLWHARTQPHTRSSAPLPRRAASTTTPRRSTTTPATAARGSRTSSSRTTCPSRSVSSTDSFPCSSRYTACLITSRFDSTHCPGPAEPFTEDQMAVSHRQASPFPPSPSHSLPHSVRSLLQFIVVRFYACVQWIDTDIASKKDFDDLNAFLTEVPRPSLACV